MTDIFLSYAREDQARIAPLAAALTAAGFDVWWDKRIAGGAEFSRETEEQLNKARVIVVAWSKAASESMWVADEATVGRAKGNLIPIVIDAAEPRIGFRQIQTIDFSNWRGGASEAAAAALVEAVRARLGAPPKTEIAPAAAKSRWRLHAAAGAAALAALGLAAVLASKFGAGDADDSSTEQTAIATADDPSLSVLEALAIELEAKGDLRAASAAYTRYAARALISDRARGLAARRKAFDLDPDSINAVLGVLYDLNFYKGPDEALALGRSIVNRPDLSPRTHAYALVMLATILIDAKGDLETAEGHLAEIRSIAAATDDATIEYAELWLSAAFDMRLNRFAAALEKSRRAEELYKRLPAGVPRNGEVQLIGALFSSGDWDATLQTGTAIIERRRKEGEFLPSPIRDDVCQSAIFLRREDEDGGVCQSVSGRGARDSDHRGKIIAALQAAAEGDFSGARGELAAAAAVYDLRTTVDPTASAPASAFDVRRRHTEVFIAARSGDFETARRILHDEMTPKNGNEVIWSLQQRARASAARLLAQEMLRQGAGEVSCAEAMRAAEYYRQMDAAPGVAALAAMARDAGC